MKPWMKKLPQILPSFAPGTPVSGGPVWMPKVSPTKMVMTPG